MNYCPGCLKEGYKTYCNSCRNLLFNGKKVEHVLPFSRPDFDQDKLNHSEKLSISGIQIKHSLFLDGSKLKLCERDGTYILKPIPHGPFNNLERVPANEHISMQIASQVFNINTASNAIIYFSDGQMAYITKRFDVAEDGTKLSQEDFAQIMQRSEPLNGKNYKYDSSYEDIAKYMRTYINAYPIEVEKFYKLVLYNYLISNGDAHLKNFSLYRNIEFGDYLLTPAYDILNTSLHVPGESDTALELFSGGYTTEAYKAGSKYTREDFYEFGLKVMNATSPKRIEKILNEMLQNADKIKELVDKSFLPGELKKVYLESIQIRRERIRR